MVQIHASNIQQFFIQVQKQSLTERQILEVTSAVQTLVDNEVNLLKWIKPKLPPPYRKKSMIDLLHIYFQLMHKFTHFLITQEKETNHVS